MSATSSQLLPIPSAWATFFHISRFHIIVIAAAASLTFGWDFSGRQNLLIPLVVGFDWFLVNLLNRVVDLAEDQINGVVGTRFVDRHAKGLTLLCWALMLGSFPFIHWVLPTYLQQRSGAYFLEVLIPGRYAGWTDLLLYRALFHLIGIAYNYKIIPWPGGFTRFKEMYFFKNFASGVLFILSGIFYPAVVEGALASIPMARLWLLVGFFLAMDLTYEIFYDLRDLPGDKAVGVPTFPVIHGEMGARRIIIGLLVTAATCLLVGYAVGSLLFQEVVMVAAVIQQALFYRIKVPQGLTQRDCVFVTYLGAAQLVSYNLWILAGLPLDLTALHR